MKTVNFCIGLPRSGSTVLMNILQQNPKIYTTGTCPLPYAVEALKYQTTSVSEFIAMPQDSVTECYKGFIKHGIDGWFNQLTDKPMVISKSRSWDSNLNILFATYEDPKFIVCLRDLRDIIASFEKLLFKNTHIHMGSREDPFHMLPMSKRVEIYCTDTGGNMGRPLMFLKHVLEWMQRRPNNFYVNKWEDFSENPTRSLRAMYNWLGMDYHEHDLNNIKQSEYYEHDTVYRALVSHVTKPKLERTPPSWPKYMSDGDSASVLQNCKWFYETFYPELLRAR